MKEVRLACSAMATRFEFLLYGADARHLRSAGEEAIREVQRVEGQLSAFQSRSPVAKINRRSGEGPVRVSAELFDVLMRCRRIWEISEGAFDITVGPLLERWGLRDREIATTRPDDVSEALSLVGLGLVELDPPRRTVALEKAGMRIDLGAVGKGYALDAAVDVLLAADVSSALLHGGTSTVWGVGSDPFGEPWKVALRDPDSGQAGLLGTVSLTNEAMSVSAVSGRSVEVDGRVVGHVIDPRTGQPVSGADMAVVVAPAATEADALSTGLLVLGAPGLEAIDRHVVDFRGAVVIGNDVTQAHNTIHIQEQATA